MTVNFIEKLHMATDGEGRIDLPSPRRRSMGALPDPATTISWLESTLTIVGDAVAGHRSPPQATVHSSGGEMNTSPCSAT
jgi:hypothetical protein